VKQQRQHDRIQYFPWPDLLLDHIKTRKFEIHQHTPQNYDDNLRLSHNCLTFTASLGVLVAGMSAAGEKYPWNLIRIIPA
jgi:hypothetical protein